MKRKERIKYIVLGMMIMAVLSTVIPAVAATIEKQITVYTGVNIYVDDTKLVDGNGKPVDAFIYNGTTYLPLRAVGQAVGKPVFWDENTRSVYLGKRAETDPKPSSSYADQVVELVNQERQKHGLKPLQHRADIKNVAQIKAEDMINSNYFSHNSPNYGSPFDMLKTFGISYSYAGENIALGYKTPQEVMKGWMNSPGHRENILTQEYDTIGVGYYNGAWVQMFIKAR